MVGTVARFRESSAAESQASATGEAGTLELCVWPLGVCFLLYKTAVTRGPLAELQEENETGGCNGVPVGSSKGPSNCPHGLHNAPHQLSVTLIPTIELHVKVAQSCPLFAIPWTIQPGILQARILEW